MYFYYWGYLIMITEDQLAFLMSLAQKHNITICQEMEKKRYVLRGRGSKIAQFLIAAGASALIADSEKWQINEVAAQIADMPLMKFAFEDLIFNK